MHCNICDRILSEGEIVYNLDLQAYEPCSVCLAIAYDAAYSGNYRDDDVLDAPDEDDAYKAYYEDDTPIRPDNLYGDL